MTEQASPPEPAEVLDGRRARRERGRRAVIASIIDLVFEGHTPPTVDQVAERAEVSVASVFRYFETLEDMREAAGAFYFERFAHVFEIPEIGDGDLARRVATFVAARVRQHEATGPMARFMRSRAFDDSDLDATLHRLRATQTDQVHLHFHEELEALTPARRADVVATVATLTSFEAWDQCVVDHQRTGAQIRRAWSTALRSLVAPPA